MALHRFPRSVLLVRFISQAIYRSLTEPFRLLRFVQEAGDPVYSVDFRLFQ